MSNSSNLLGWQATHDRAKGLAPFMANRQNHLALPSQRSADYRVRKFSDADIKFFESFLNTDPKAAEDMGRRIEAAHNQAPPKTEEERLQGEQAVLNELRVTQVDNFIWANTNFGMFFQSENLGPADRPMWINEARREGYITLAGQDNKPHRIRIERDQTEQLLNLISLVSPRHEYVLEDIYRGNLGQAATNTLMIGTNFENDINRRLKTLLTATPGNGGAFGSFTTTGSRQARTFLKSEFINADNLPTTNDIVCSDGGNSTTSKFRLPVIRDGLNYCEQWGTAFGALGPLRPTGVIILPSKDVMGLADTLSAATPGAVYPNAIIQSAFASYTTIDWFGKWILIGDNTLPVDNAYAYFVLNRPVGKHFTKTSWDRQWDKADEENNVGYRSGRKAYGAYIDSAWRVNAVRVKYRNAS